MWSIIFVVVLSALVLFNLIRVIVYGKSIFKPNFEIVDERVTRKTGFKSSWNTWYGKTIYYLLLSAFMAFVLLLVYTLVS